MELELAFRKLRGTWFNYHLKRYAHERDWEDEESEKSREENNAQLKIKYDSQTKDIINGVDRCLAPTCMFDMDKK